VALTQPLILLDTNVVLYFLGGRLTNPLPSGQYFVSVITEIELLSYPSLTSDEEIQIRDLLTKITVVGIVRQTLSLKYLTQALTFALDKLGIEEEL
jgi:predicted nucleic acid-binding protein